MSERIPSEELEWEEERKTTTGFCLWCPDGGRPTFLLPFQPCPKEQLQPSTSSPTELPSDLKDEVSERWNIHGGMAGERWLMTPVQRTQRTPYAGMLRYTAIVNMKTKAAPLITTQTNHFLRSKDLLRRHTISLRVYLHFLLISRMISPRRSRGLAIAAQTKAPSRSAK
jgi:hypothetical protein